MLFPLPQLLPLLPPREGLLTPPGPPPKASSLWNPSWWSPSRELDLPDFGALCEGPEFPRPTKEAQAVTGVSLSRVPSQTCHVSSWFCCGVIIHKQAVAETCNFMPLPSIQFSYTDLVSPLQFRR